MRVVLVALALSMIARATLQAQGAPTASTTQAISADSQYKLVRTRLEKRNYRIDQADPLSHQLIVRPPDQNTKVEVRITKRGDSAEVSVTPIGASDLIQGMTAVLTVTHDATFAAPGEPEPPAPPSELPKARWRPELFVTPTGRLWMARGGLYTADSLRGHWRRVIGIERDSVEPDELLIGNYMAFIDDTTAILGLPDRFGKSSLQLFRTTDAGAAWTPIPRDDLARVNEAAAIGKSVWVFGTRWENDTTSRPTFLESHDGGETWTVVALPPQLYDIGHLYRVSRVVAYVSVWGYKHGPYLWRTADSGRSWSVVPTPFEQHMNRIPESGVHIEEIATVGAWLAVREFGEAFVTRADSVHWRRLEGIEHVAADTMRSQLFVLTKLQEAEMLDSNLNVLWRTKNRIPGGNENEVEKVIARDGTGFVSVTNSDVFEARNGVLQRVHPKP